MGYIKNITEKNINEAIKYCRQLGHDYVQTYQIIASNLTQEKYNSIGSNYTALFLHHIIKDKVDIKEFDEVIKCIYKIGANIDNGLHRFFSLKDCDISLRKYLELQKPNVPESERNYGIWNEMSLFFYDIKNENFALKKDRVPYLESICKFIPEDKMYKFYSSSFVHFCLSCLNNLDDLNPIFKAIQNNSAFNKSDGNQYKDFFTSFIRGVSDRSYEASHEEKLYIYEKLSEMINNFEDVFLDRLIKYNPNERTKKFSFDLGLVNFINIVGDEKFIGHINKVFQEALLKEISDETNKLNPYGILSSLKNDISSSLEVSFSKKKYDVNYDMIDLNKTFFENYVYIKLLEMNIISGNEPYVNKQVREYIQKEFEIDASKEYGELSILLDTDNIQAYINYLSISENLPKKTSSSPKMKI